MALRSASEAASAGATAASIKLAAAAPKVADFRIQLSSRLYSDDIRRAAERRRHRVRVDARFRAWRSEALTRRELLMSERWCAALPTEGNERDRRAFVEGF